MCPKCAKTLLQTHLQYQKVIPQTPAENGKGRGWANGCNTEERWREGVRRLPEGGKRKVSAYAQQIQLLKIIIV
jgi:hypothetical protein